VVDNFAQSFIDETVRLKPEANTMKYTLNGSTRSLNSFLSEALTNYMIAKSDFERLERTQQNHPNEKVFLELILEQIQLITTWRQRCFQIINIAKSNDLIEDNTIAHKLEKIEREKEELIREKANLQEVNGKLERKVDELKKENARLHALVPDSRRGLTEIGGFE
jgi:predicted nuclease with TOPRIM domain